MNMQEEKKKVRKEIKQQIAGLSEEYCRTADAEIQRNTAEFLKKYPADMIFCFVGTLQEIDTKPILKEILRDGKRLGVPKCVGKGIMDVYEIRSLDELQPGSYGILEPKEGCPLIKPEEIELALVPCLSCNEDGWRLGYGGGFYDRYLVRTRAKRAVLCRSVLMRDNIPRDELDLQMDAVITESFIRERTECV